MAETFKREAAATPMDFSGERLTSAISGEVAIEHYHRYFLARDFCAGVDVLDIAAGEGYGSAILAQVARSVVGVEIDPAVVVAANAEFVRPNLRYIQGDARAIPLPDGSIDVAVSFETFEHFGEHELFLAELRRVLRPNGLVIISTPDRDIYSGPGIPPNPFHVREVNRPEFETALSAHFRHVRIGRQRSLIGSFIEGDQENAPARHFEARGHDLVEAGQVMERATYLIAFASNAEIPPLPRSLYVYRSDVDTDSQARHAAQAQLQSVQQFLAREEQRLALAEQRHATDRESAKKLEMQLSAAISAFDGANQELQRLKASVSWRASAPLRYLTTRYPGTARRLRQGGKLAYWTVTGQLVQRLRSSIAYRFSPASADMVVPADALEGLSPDGLPLFLENYLAERWLGQDFDAVKSAYRFVAERPEQPLDVSALSDAEPAALLARLRKDAEEPGDAPCPEISIIVPVHNALAHTLGCLRSLLGQPTRHSFEILIADDVSTDATAAAISAIGGKVRLVRQPKNLGFVRNCNAAAAEARGNILVFLNNDTIVLPGWLDELVGPLQADERIGLTCSKLLNADGTLQEAGGIFWQDGSAWNYGRGADPRAYPFNFVRDTDFGSGAAIAVPARFWNEVGGFDDTFAPAYCEDADLAFALRARGYRTLYIPFAEVVHHEGVSHGRDERSGIKAYQVANLQKLKEKWSVALASHFPSGSNLAQAASRSASKTRVLVIDHYAPQPDRDAGSRSMDCYIRLLLDSGFHLTFWSENRAFDPSYTPLYQRLGVEMVYAHPGRIEFRDWIAQRGGDFQYCFVSRPHVAEPILADLRRHTTAKLLFNGVDVHIMRLRAERDLRASAELDQEIIKTDAMERGVWDAVDAIYYPSQDEVDFVIAQGVKAPVRALPLYLFEDSAIHPRSFRDDNGDGEQHLLFVGGFAHRPNVDGILWFVSQVWPLVKKRLPKTQLSIAGSNPLPEIVKLASDDIKVVGFVSDETLAQLYDEVDAAIAPLRFGAGVKGKVVEALRVGTPIVITSVAAQGIPDIRDVCPVADTADAFAEATIALLESRSLRVSTSRNGQDLIRRHFSIDAVRDVFSQDIPELRPAGAGERPPTP